MANAVVPSVPTVLIVGSGLGGLYCAKRLEALMHGRPVEIVVVSPLDHTVYVSLLPEVSTGVVEPRHLAVSLHRALTRSRIVLGEVTALDMDANTAQVSRLDEAPITLAWDRLVLAPGAAVAAPAVPGLAEHAIGYKTLAHAAYLRDHVLRQLTIADATESDRTVRCTFVVIGGGYTGTEVAGQMQWFTHKALARFPNLKSRDLHWVLVEAKPQLMSQLGSHLGTAALAHLRKCGIDVRLSTAAKEIGEEQIRFSNGEAIATRTAVWCAGTRPLDFVLSLGLPFVHDGIVVDATLRVPDRPDVFAFGDSAAVPDLTRPGQLCPQTAQHAVRQGDRAARNVAATLGIGEVVPYKHHDLGFVADLGGWYGVADPLHVPLSGISAKVITKGYHLWALPTMTNRLRVLADWTLNLLTPNQLVELDFVPRSSVAVHAPKPQLGTPNANPKPVTPHH